MTFCYKINLHGEMHNKFINITPKQHANPPFHVYNKGRLIKAYF